MGRRLLESLLPGGSQRAKRKGGLGLKESRYRKASYTREGGVPQKGGADRLVEKYCEPDLPWGRRLAGPGGGGGEMWKFVKMAAKRRAKAAGQKGKKKEKVY